MRTNVRIEEEEEEGEARKERKTKGKKKKEKRIVYTTNPPFHQRSRKMRKRQYDNSTIHANIVTVLNSMNSQIKYTNTETIGPKSPPPKKNPINRNNLVSKKYETILNLYPAANTYSK